MAVSVPAPWASTRSDEEPQGCAVPSAHTTENAALTHTNGLSTVTDISFLLLKEDFFQYGHTTPCWQPPCCTSSHPPAKDRNQELSGSPFNTIRRNVLVFPPSKFFKALGKRSIANILQAHQLAAGGQNGTAKLLLVCKKEERARSPEQHSA